MNHLVGVMLSPGKTFDAIRSKTSWSVPLIVLLILSVVTVWLQMPVIQKLALQALKDAGRPRRPSA
ncbi:hypothetical protein LJK88_28620 [Paenibacillus sp. P26]|nr:hypothetical protein LJK88_28620 [Paenibacillus sp. P26]